MSEFTEILQGRIRLKRLTSSLLDKKAVAASMTVDRQPLQACRLAIEVVGCTVLNGTISLAGSTTDSLNFSANGTQVNTKDFTNISGITVAGISNGFIQIKAVSKTGQPMNQEKEIYASLPVKFFPLSGRIRMMAPGQEKVAQYKFMAELDKDIQENDLIYALSGIAGLTRGQVSFVETFIDFDGITHHLEAEVMTP